MDNRRDPCSNGILLYLVCITVSFLVVNLSYSFVSASLVAQMVKYLPVVQETCVRPLEEEMTTHSSILAWRIPWTEEPGRLCTWGQRVRHDCVTNTKQLLICMILLGLLGVSAVKSLLQSRRPMFDSWVRKIPGGGHCNPF